ncbi:hypothetical protein B0T18DRAFT_188649 [Schizothecium vesticola]|uniref:Uncharacterized protein n=1 Tax=Schizothecium vesticola TaxID=314040 RepID=A0AA40EQJ6_9PEZI|nr:hypothetical protein B0T18DRAFT_188649 [Schizothecium vesticola]
MVGSRIGLRHCAARGAGGPAPSEPDYDRCYWPGGERRKTTQSCVASTARFSFASIIPLPSFFFLPNQSRVLLLCSASPSRPRKDVLKTPADPRPPRLVSPDAATPNTTGSTWTHIWSSRYRIKVPSSICGRRRSGFLCPVCSRRICRYHNEMEEASPRVRSIWTSWALRTKTRPERKSISYGTVFLFSIGAIPTPAYTTQHRERPLRLYSTASHNTESQKHKVPPLVTWRLTEERMKGSRRRA